MYSVNVFLCISPPRPALPHYPTYVTFPNRMHFESLSLVPIFSYSELLLSSFQTADTDPTDLAAY